MNDNGQPGLPLLARPSGLSATVQSQEGMAAFAAIVSLFGKVGKELLIEGQKDMLVLRALNDAKTAFASVELQQGVFFQDYAHKAASRAGIQRADSAQSSQGDEDPFLGKILLRALGPALRNVKKMKTLSIREELVDGVSHELVFQMACAYGIQRTHRFGYQECSALSAVFDDTEASYLSVEIGIFRQLLEQVDHSAQVELEASRDSFKIRSFYQTLAGGPAAQRHMSSEMVMHTREFLQYNFRSRERTEELVIATKELKSIIAFCEAIEIPIFSIYFYGGGRPCKLCCEHASFVVSLVVATLEPPNRNSANRGNNGELGSDMQAEEQAVFHKNSKRNDANIDSTIRRLAPISAEEHVNSSQLENGLQESPSERSSNMAYHAGFNIGVLADKNDETLNRKKKARLESSDTDESDKKYNDIMYAEDLAKFPRQEQQQNICDVHEKSKNICFTGDSDEVLGPSKVAFSRSSLKRLIDSDSDDDGFDELRKL